MRAGVPVHLTMLGYELPWNHITFATQAFVVLDEEPPAAEMGGVDEVREPAGDGAARTSGTSSSSRWHACAGLQVKAAFAEAYEAIRIRM